MDLFAFFLRRFFWLNDLLKGRPISKQYRDISLIIEKNDDIRKRKHLSSILSHAVCNSKFYKNYDPENLKSFPVVNKNILREHYEQICIKPESIPFQRGEVFVQKTSGSTGTPFSVPQDTIKRQRRIAELKYFGHEVGFKSHEKLIHLRTWNRWQAKTKKQIFWENIIPFDIASMGEQNLRELCELIKTNNVHTIRGYASSIDQLVKYIQRESILLPSLRLMIAGSESLEDITREIVENIGGGKINIISQYANEENGILAQELINEPKEVFFLNEASYFFEILKLDCNEPALENEVGRIVLTDLFNYAFPLLRYDTGDVGAISERNGRKVLTKLYGRKMDLVYDSQGDTVSPMTLARIFKHFDWIEQWQFVQTNKNNYEVRLKVKIHEANNSELLVSLKEVFGQAANIVFKFVDDIPLLDSRKRKPVVNLWQ